MDTTLQGFAGADYDLQARALYLCDCMYIQMDVGIHEWLLKARQMECLLHRLQDCIVGATYKKSGKRNKDGQEFYDYELSSSVSLLAPFAAIIHGPFTSAAE